LDPSPCTPCPRTRDLRLDSHPNWPMVIVNFIRDPEVGVFARVEQFQNSPAQELQRASEKDWGGSIENELTTNRIL